MSIVFFGTDRFAIPFLERLADNNLVALVVTQPDTKAGRGRILVESPVKILAKSLGLPIFQPSNLKNEETLDKIADYSPKCSVVVSYGNKLPKRLLQLPAIGSFNIHPSLLPKFRGPSPIQYAILEGEKQIGLTLYKMTNRIDAGPIAFQAYFDINENEIYIDVEEKIASLGSQVSIDWIKLILENRFNLTEQDESQATYTRKIEKSDGLLDFSKDAVSVYNHVRAFQGWPGSYCYLVTDKRRLKVEIISACIVHSHLPKAHTPGTVAKIDKDSFWLACSSEFIAIKELKPESKNRMSAKDFINGYKFEIGQRFLGL